MDILKWHNKFSKDLELRYNSKSTIKTYLYAVKMFLEYFKEQKEPKSIPNELIKSYLLQFNTLNARKHSLCGIGAFYRLTVGMPRKIKSIPYPKKEKKLPRVIDSKHILYEIGNIKNLKHKAILSIAFSVGLRVSEVINLKISDVDSKRMIISVINAKGGKDRIVPLSHGVLELFRKYYLEYKPREYLFNGQKSMKYSAVSCNKLVKKYLGNEYHFHTLRHSSFTSMLENGTDLSLIQKIAGHNRIETTQIYTHISQNLIQQVQTPI